MRSHSTTGRKALSLALLLLLFGLVVSACSDNAEVGSGVNTEGGGGGLAGIGEETTTTVPAILTTPSTAAPTTAPPTTAARVTTTAAPKPVATTAAPRDNSFPITINGDNKQEPQFDPPQAAVAVGTVVKFVNADTVVRSVIAQNGSFRSPDIPPGGNWLYKASTPGEFNYQDGTRPYAVGRLEVR